MNTEKNKEIEIIKVDTRYASESLSEIPMGYWIDKSVGGCGLSYLCLKDKNDSIILMPRNALINNKIEQTNKYSNLFAVNVGVTRGNVYDYITEMRLRNIPVKILVTYDSFALGKLDYLLEDKLCRIYVDESQFILGFAEDKPKLINELHKRLKDNIDRVTFFSAHPPKREYLPTYIQEMPSIKYVWKNQTKATPYIIDTDKPYNIATKILSELLVKKSCTIENITFTKAIVFLNSVEGLKKIAEPLKSKENIAYVVGDTVRNDNKLNEVAHPLQDCRNLPIITLGTTSLISGFDLEDNETLNIVISTSTKDFTLMDKELDVPQAITRQRLDTNPHNNKFLFIVDTKDMDNKITKLEETYNQDFIKISTVVENLNYLKAGNKDCTVGFELYDGYYLFENDEFIINESLLKARKYIYEQLYKQYQEGYNVIATDAPVEKFTVNLGIFHSKQYYDYATEIIEAKTTGDKLTLLNAVSNKLWKEYLTYGLEKDNVKTNVSEAKAFYESRNDYKGIVMDILKTFKVGNFYTNAYIKETLQEIYNKKGLNRKAKATDLYEFFEVETSSKRENFIKVFGLIIKSKLMNINK